MHDSGQSALLPFGKLAWCFILSLIYQSEEWVHSTNHTSGICWCQGWFYTYICWPFYEVYKPIFIGIWLADTNKYILTCLSRVVTYMSLLKFAAGLIAQKNGCAWSLDCSILKLLITWFSVVREVTLTTWSALIKGFDRLIQFWSWSQTLQHGTCKWLTLSNFPPPWWAWVGISVQDYIFSFSCSGLFCEWPYHGGWEQGWHQSGVHMLPLQRLNHPLGHHYPGVKLHTAVNPWVIQCAVSACVHCTVVAFIVPFLLHCQWKLYLFSLSLPFFLCFFRRCFTSTLFCFFFSSLFHPLLLLLLLPLPPSPASSSSPSSTLSCFFFFSLFHSPLLLLLLPLPPSSASSSSPSSTLFCFFFSLFHSPLLLLLLPLPPSSASSSSPSSTLFCFFFFSLFHSPLLLLLHLPPSSASSSSPSSTLSLSLSLSLSPTLSLSLPYRRLLEEFFYSDLASVNDEEPPTFHTLIFNLQTRVDNYMYLIEYLFWNS